MALRGAVISEIEGVLCGSRTFTRADFHLDVEASHLFRVTFLPSPEFKFQLEEEVPKLPLGVDAFNFQGRPRRLVCEVTPGAVKRKERRVAADMDDVLRMLSDWILHVDEELRSSRVPMNQSNEILEEIEKRISESVESPEEPFSESEVSDWGRRLDALTEQMEELARRDEITHAELNGLKATVDQMRSTLPSYPKGIWIRTTGSKLMTDMMKLAKSKEGRLFLLAAAKKYFLGE